MEIKTPEAKIEKLEPEASTLLASSLSNLDRIAKLNVILWHTYIDVRYISNKVKGQTRICIISDDFPVDKNQDFVKNGRAFLVTDVLRAGVVGVYLLVYPVVELEVTAQNNSYSKWVQNANNNLKSMEDALHNMAPDQKYAPISIWAAGIGAEFRGQFCVQPPSFSNYTFTPTSQEYNPAPGTEELLDTGMKTLFGEMAKTRTHPKFVQLGEQHG